MDDGGGRQVGPFGPPGTAPAGKHWEVVSISNGMGHYNIYYVLVDDPGTVGSNAPPPPVTGGSSPTVPTGPGAKPAPPPIHLSFSFDTIGQIIPRTIGDCRLPLKTLWIQGIDLPYDTLLIQDATPAGSDILVFNSIPPWIGVGLQVSGPVGIPPNTTILVIDNANITMSNAATENIPIDSVITFTQEPGSHKLSPDTFVMTADAALGATSLVFGALPSWLAVGAAIEGSTGIPGGTVLASASGTTAFLSQPTIAAIPAGTAISFGGGPQTVTFAGALCAPFDPTEQGLLVEIFDGADLVFSDTEGIALPQSWTSTEQALLAISLAGIMYYPGTESQLPAPLISNDRGAAVTNAFRGIRYIVVPNYPLRRGGIPRLTARFHRTNHTTAPPIPSRISKNNIIAVEFTAGSG